MKRAEDWNWRSRARYARIFLRSSAYADANKVVIGDIDDMSGPYADVIGPSGVEAIENGDRGFRRLRAGAADRAADGRPPEQARTQGVQKFREWADQNGLTMVLGGSNTGVSLAINAAVKEKKIPFFAIGAAGASLTGKDCTPYTMHYGYDTTALANGTAKTILKQGRQVVVLPHRRLRLRHPTAKRSGRFGEGRRRDGGGRRARATRNLRLRVLSVAGAEFGRAGPRARQRRHRLLQFVEGRQ